MGVWEKFQGPGCHHIPTEVLSTTKVHCKDRYILTALTQNSLEDAIESMFQAFKLPDSEMSPFVTISFMDELGKLYESTPRTFDKCILLHHYDNGIKYELSSEAEDLFKEIIDNYDFEFNLKYSTSTSQITSSQPVLDTSEREDIFVGNKDCWFSRKHIACVLSI